LVRIFCFETEMKEQINIGKTLKTHGFNGSLKIVVNPLFLKEVVKSKYFFINKLPYFVENIQKAGAEQFIVKFEDVNTKEAVQNLCNQSLYIDKKNIKNWQQNVSEKLLVDYKIYDNDKYIGIINEIVEMPQQILLSTTIENKEVLIPLNEDFMLEINEAEQKIILNLPENYLQIFLE